MTKFARMIPVHDYYRAPVGFTFKYQPGPREDHGEEVFLVTREGIVMHDDAAMVAKSLFPDDIEITDIAPQAPIDEPDVDNQPEDVEDTAEAIRGLGIAGIDSLGVRELRQLAASRYVEGRSKMNKAELLEALG